MGALRPFRFFISSVPSYFVIMDVRVCRCRRKSRRYAALPFRGLRPPRGPRPLCGHCPGLILRLAATRLPGALRLCSMPSLAYGATVTSAASHAFIFHRKWALCAHSVFYIIRSVVFRNHGCTRASLSAKEPQLCGSAFWRTTKAPDYECGCVRCPRLISGFGAMRFFSRCACRGVG